MSIVRYVNKKTGQVALYESTSHYDPETQQSRPIRKYLGIEDPETGELIPSAGKRGRKAGSKNKSTVIKGIDSDLKYQIESLKKELLEKENEIKNLKKRIEMLEGYLKRLNQMSNTMMETINRD